MVSPKSTAKAQFFNILEAKVQTEILRRGGVGMNGLLVALSPYTYVSGNEVLVYCQVYVFQLDIKYPSS